MEPLDENDPGPLRPITWILTGIFALAILAGFVLRACGRA